MIDDAECNTDGILTVTSYSKKPATEFAVWLRGCSNALRNDKQITIPAFAQSSAPYTADIKVQHLKTTDAIELYAGLIKSDSELTAEQKAEKIKIRRKYLNMIDDAECNTDGILTVTSYSKKPATEFAVWLRGCSAEEE
ncbi:hypothetical protein FMM82_01540 [[Clostridium] clostridioforme]|nr:hypothetical protein [Enterocloster clostridioformis]